MATGDKLVNLDELKLVYDKLHVPSVQVQIPTGQWSGSSTRTYTVNATGVTADTIVDWAMDSSINYLTSDLTVTPGSGTITFSTSTLPAGTINVTLFFPGVNGEVVIQTLADVYSKSQVDQKIAQSTANVSTLKSGETTVGNIICAGYNTGSGNYFYFFVPISAKGLTPISASASSDTVIFTPTGRIPFSSQPSITIRGSMHNGVLLEVGYPSTQTPNICGTIYVINLKIVCQ